MIRCTAYAIGINIIASRNNKFRFEFFCDDAHFSSNFCLIILSVSTPVAKYNKLKGFLFDFLFGFVFYPRMFLGIRNGCNKKQTDSQNNKTHTELIY